MSGPALLVGLLLWAQAEPPSAPTRMGLELLRPATLVAVVRTEKVTAFGMGTAVARVVVEERLSTAGPEPGEPVVVFAYQGDLVPGAHDLLFLESTPSGRHRILERVDGRDPDFLAKRDMVRQTIAITRLDTPEERAAATFELLRTSLAHRDPWTRRYAIKELQWAATRPALGVLDPQRARRLEAFADSTDIVVRAGVESVTITMARRARALRPPRTQESSAP